MVGCQVVVLAEHGLQRQQLYPLGLKLLPAAAAWVAVATSREQWSLLLLLLPPRVRKLKGWLAVCLVVVLLPATHLMRS
jgi:hypothetical protein